MAIFPDCVSQRQNVSILDFIGAKDDGGGGDNWSYQTCNAIRGAKPQTNHHQQHISTQHFYRPDNNNNNNNHDNIYSAVIMTRSLREFTRFIW